MLENFPLTFVSLAPWFPVELVRLLPYLPLVTVLLPMFAGGVLVLYQIKSERWRHVFIEGVTLLNSALVAFMVLTPKVRWYTLGKLVLWRITDDLTLALRLDSTARVFVLLVAFIWPLVTLYAFEYLRRRPPENRFFAPLLATYGILVGLACAANFLTLYLFFELMTFMTLPIVMHSQRQEAIRGTVMYLLYSATGAALALCGFFIIRGLGYPLDFVAGGVLSRAANGGVLPHAGALRWAVFLSLVGFGAKGGLFPLHAWLPTAHPVAPTPASAVLSGLITKGGVIAILRVAYCIAGPEFLRGTWVQRVLLCMALFTIFAGSMLACVEKHLKRRIAWSSVSQVSYVIFGLMLLTPEGLTGALLQAAAHALGKGCLFLSAGVVIYFTWAGEPSPHYVDQLRGAGKNFPVTMTCFGLASLSIIGLPVTGGFAAKWMLMTGALGLDEAVLGIAGVVILLVSALLTAMYLLPIVVTAFFPGADFDYPRVRRFHMTLHMRVPLYLLSLAAVFVGVYSGVLADWIGRHIVAVLLR